MGYLELAEKRKSTRDFTGKAVRDAQLLALLQHFPKTQRLDPSIGAEVRILTGKDTAKVDGWFGYEQMAFEAPAYLLVFSEKKEGYLKNAGMIMEDMILKMTELGVDNVWLSVLDEAFPVLDRFRAELSLKEPVVVGAVAMGYTEGKGRRFRLHVLSPSNVKFISRPAELTPKMDPEELIFGDEFGKPFDLNHEYADSGLRRALLSVIYAPSFLNRQPVRLLVDMEEHQVVLVSTRDEKTGPDDAKLNCGAAMANFALALSDRRPEVGKWNAGVPEKAYALPEGATIEGYFVF